MLQCVRDWLIAEYYSWPLLIPVLFCTGIILYFNLQFEPSYLLPLCCTTICFIAFWNANFRVVYVAGLILCMGFSAAQFRTYFLNTSFIPKDMNVYDITGKVLDISYKNSKQKILIGNLKNSFYKLDNVSIYIGNDCNVGIGDIIEFSAFLRRPSLPQSSYSYNYAFHAYFSGISAIGYALGDIKIVKKSNMFHKYIISGYRDKMYNHFIKLFGDKYGNVLSAVILGKRSGIDKESLENIRKSGLAHLLAISGLHLAIVAMFCFNATRIILLCISFSSHSINHKIASVCSIIASFFYLMISGAPISAQRAFIMIAMYFVLVIINRISSNLHFVALAATMVALVAPESVMGPSFQMSFAAVTGLIFVYEYLSEHYKFNFVINIIISSCVASLCTLPYTAYIFNNFALGGVISNVIAIPCMSFLILPFGILSLILYFFYIDVLIAPIIKFGIWITLFVAKFVADYPYSSINIAQISGYSLAFLTLGFLWIVLWHTKVRYFGIIIILCSFILIFFKKLPEIILNDKYIAVKNDDNGITFLGKARKNYTTDSWIKLYGLTEIKNDHRYVKGSKFCKNSVCIYNFSNGKRMAILYMKTNVRLNLCKDGFDIVVYHGDKIIICNSSLGSDNMVYNLTANDVKEVYFGQNISVLDSEDFCFDRPWCKNI